MMLNNAIAAYQDTITIHNNAIAAYQDTGMMLNNVVAAYSAAVFASRAAPIPTNDYLPSEKQWWARMF